MMVRDEGGRKGKEQGRGKPRPYYTLYTSLASAAIAFDQGANDA